MRKMVEVLGKAEPTYSDIGATLAGTPPDGFHHDHYEAVLGTGPETFQRAVAGLKAWEAHRLPVVPRLPQRPGNMHWCHRRRDLGNADLGLSGALPDR